MMNSSNLIFSRAWVNLVFDNRNKAYGAYQLRMYANRILVYIILGVLVVSFLLALSINFVSQIKPLVITKFDDGIFLKNNPEIILPPPVIDLPLPKDAPLSLIKQINEAQPLIVIDKNKPEVSIIATTNIVNAVEGNLSNTGANTVNTGTSVVNVPNIIGGVGTPENIENTIYTVAEISPFFEGLNLFLIKNIVYPSFAKDNDISGTVYINFVVEKDGSLSNFKVLRSPKNAQSLENEAIRVLKLMPAWTAGMYNKQKVRVSCTLPISFRAFQN